MKITYLYVFKKTFEKRMNFAVNKKQVLLESGYFDESCPERDEEVELMLAERIINL